MSKPFLPVPRNPLPRLAVPVVVLLFPLLTSDCLGTVAGDFSGQVMIFFFEIGIGVLGVSGFAALLAADCLQQCEWKDNIGGNGAELLIGWTSLDILLVPWSNPYQQTDLE